MSRPRTSKFIKYDVMGNLFGSLRYDLSPAEYSIWDRLLALAKLGQTEGVISNRAWPPEAIVSLFNLGPYGGIELYNATIKKLVDTERVEVLSDGSLNIINWHKYQDVPEWVQQQRENLYKKLARLKAEQNKPQELFPSDELKEVANKIEQSASIMLNGGDENGK